MRGETECENIYTFVRPRVIPPRRAPYLYIGYFRSARGTTENGRVRDNYQQTRLRFGSTVFPTDEVASFSRADTRVSCCALCRVFAFRTVRGLKTFTFRPTRPTRHGRATDQEISCATRRDARAAPARDSSREYVPKTQHSSAPQSSELVHPTNDGLLGYATAEATRIAATANDSLCELFIFFFFSSRAVEI